MILQLSKATQRGKCLKSFVAETGEEVSLDFVRKITDASGVEVSEIWAQKP